MFSVRLKELREAAGYRSQQAFADAFGVAQSTVGGWEAGKRRPNHETTIRLAEFLGVSVDSLLVGDAAPSAAQKDSPAPMTEGEAYWAERLNGLTPPDQALVASIVDGFEENPGAMRAALDLALRAVRSAPRGP